MRSMELGASKPYFLPKKFVSEAEGDIVNDLGLLEAQEGVVITARGKKASLGIM